MSIQLKLLILAIVIVVGALFYFQDHKEGGNRLEIIRAISKEEFASVEAIKVKNREGTFILRRIGEEPELELNEWQLESAGYSTLEPSKIMQLLIALRDLTVIPVGDINSEGDSLDKYGFDSNSTTIAFTTASGGRELTFGALNSYLNQRYLKFGDRSEIYLAGTLLYDVVAGSEQSFLDRTPATFDPGAVTEVDVQTAKERYRLELNEQKFWVVRGEARERAGESAVRSFLNEIKNLRADEFIAGEMTAASLPTEPELTIKLSFVSGDADTVEVFRAKDSGSYFTLAKSPTIFRSYGDLVSDLSLKSEYFDDRTIIEFAPEKVEQAEFAGVEKVSFENGANGWKVNGKRADEPFVRELLKRLSKLSGISCAQDKRAIGEAVLTIDLKVASQEQGENLKVTVEKGEAVGGHLLSRVRSSTRPRESCLVPVAEIKRVTPREESYLVIEIPGDDTAR